MAVTSLSPSTAAEEIFGDTFRAEALDLVPLDAVAVPRAFDAVALEVSLRSAYLQDGLVPPLELIVAAPNGRHVVRELTAVPLAVLFTPDAGGTWRATLREVAHNRWWGTTDVLVTGEPAS